MWEFQLHIWRYVNRRVPNLGWTMLILQVQHVHLVLTLVRLL